MIAIAVFAIASRPEVVVGSCRCRVRAAFSWHSDRHSLHCNARSSDGSGSVHGVATAINTASGGKGNSNSNDNIAMSNKSEAWMLRLESLPVTNEGKQAGPQALIRTPPTKS